MTDKYAEMDPVALLEEVRKLDARINNPITHDFLKGVQHEAAHQVGRWGSANDRGKTPLDWFWLIGFLSQKAATASQGFLISDRCLEEAIEVMDQFRYGPGPKIPQMAAVFREVVENDMRDKALHHTISTAAALLNWHAQLAGQPLDPESSMRPGIDPATVEKGHAHDGG